MKAWRAALIIGLLTPALPAAGVASQPAPSVAMRQPSPACVWGREGTQAPAPRAVSTRRLYPEAAGQWLTVLSLQVRILAGCKPGAQSGGSPQ